MKKGLKVFTPLLSVFEKNGFSLDVKCTNHAHHANECVRSCPLHKYYGVVIVGGDGTIHEVINGLLSSEDGMKKPLGIIPAGTGNSLVTDLGKISPTDAIVPIIKDQRIKINLMNIEYGGEVLYSFNVIGWGLPTDVNILAEKLRKFGKQRYNLSALIKKTTHPPYGSIPCFIHIEV